MKFGLIALLLAVLTAGCASTKAIVPALDGTQRVPVNREIPAAVPYTAPKNDNAQGGQ